MFNNAWHTNYELKVKWHIRNCINAEFDIVFYRDNETIRKKIDHYSSSTCGLLNFIYFNINARVVFIKTTVNYANQISLLYAKVINEQSLARPENKTACTTFDKLLTNPIRLATRVTRNAAWGKITLGQYSNLHNSQCVVNSRSYFMQENVKDF